MWKMTGAGCSGAARTRIWPILGLMLVASFTGCGSAFEGDDSATIAGAGSVAEVLEPPRAAELSNTFASVHELGSAILDALADGDEARLLDYRLTASEFRWLIWPQLPASRPDRGLTWGYVWRDTDQKSRNSLRFTLRSHAGRRYRLLRVEFDGETTDHGTYRVHRDARSVVEDENGELRRLDLFGSVIESKGRFKAYSYVVD